MTTTFNVSVAPKTSSSPVFGQGSNNGYVINGQQTPTITLVRGQTYTFNLDRSVNEHPFYLTTNSVGGAANQPDNGAITLPQNSGSFTFTPDSDTLSSFYYQCNIHNNMGYVVNVVDSRSIAHKKRYNKKSNRRFMTTQHKLAGMELNFYI